MLGFFAGAAFRHFGFPKVTSEELTQEFADAVRRLNERLDEREAEKTNEDKETPTP